MTNWEETLTNEIQERYAKITKSIPNNYQKVISLYKINTEVDLLTELILKYGQTDIDKEALKNQLEIMKNNTKNIENKLIEDSQKTADQDLGVILQERSDKSTEILIKSFDDFSKRK